MNGCRPLTQSEVKKIQRVADPREKVLVLTGVTLGLRISESLLLTFGALSGSDVYIDSKKGSMKAWLPVHAKLKRALTSLKRHYLSKGIAVTDTTPVFLSQKGGALTVRAANRLLVTLAQKAGLTGKVNGHSFRKYFVNEIWEMTGHDIFQTRMYSRHKNIQNLIYYVNVSDRCEMVHKIAA